MQSKKSVISGMSLVEIIIGCAIVSVGILALINAYSIYVKYALTHNKEVQATYLLEEGLEAMTLLRDQSWSGKIAPLTASVPYYLSWNGASWATGSVSEVVDGVFWRSVVMENVVRDGTDKIAASGSADPNTKKVTVTVSYRQSTGTTTRSISKYLTNLYAN